MAGDASRRNGRLVGRRNGVPNKLTAELRELITQALEGAGGVEYPTRQAEQNPPLFLSLLAKLLPAKIAGAEGETRSRFGAALEPPEPGITLGPHTVTANR